MITLLFSVAAFLLGMLLWGYIKKLAAIRALDKPRYIFNHADAFVTVCARIDHQRSNHFIRMPNGRKLKLVPESVNLWDTSISKPHARKLLQFKREFLTGVIRTDGCTRAAVAIYLLKAFSPGGIGFARALYNDSLFVGYSSEGVMSYEEQCNAFTGPKGGEVQFQEWRDYLAERAATDPALPKAQAYLDRYQRFRIPRRALRLATIMCTAFAIHLAGQDAMLRIEARQAQPASITYTLPDGTVYENTAIKVKDQGDQPMFEDPETDFVIDQGLVERVQDFGGNLVLVCVRMESAPLKQGCVFAAKDVSPKKNSVAFVKYGQILAPPMEESQKPVRQHRFRLGGIITQREAERLVATGKFRFRQ